MLFGAAVQQEKVCLAKKLTGIRMKSDLRCLCFQIETRLENPTKYHVLESQKRQVAEYLSESSPTGSTEASSNPPSKPAAQAGSGSSGVGTSSCTNVATSGRRVSGPFSPSFSSAATSPSEYTPSEVHFPKS